MAMTPVGKCRRPSSTQRCRRDVLSVAYGKTVPYGSAMSRRLGRIERALGAIFDNERDNAFTIEDLCERIWPDLYPDRQGGRIERKHRRTVIRAARNIARQRPEIQWLRGARLGGGLVFFRHD